MSNFFEQHRRIIVLSLLLLSFSLGLLTMVNDSAIVDEIAHIPAGYSYVRYSDYRLNPEHPPLIKDLAGLPLLLLDLEFPLDHPSWTRDVNGQWEVGWHFLYHYGNNADLILLFARLPMLLLATVFGWLIYIFTRKIFGTPTALLALFFYALSPNFLAHSHFVTTDVGIAMFIFLSLATFAQFIKNPTLRNLVWATVALAGAQVAKFSAVLLIPLFFLIFVCLIFTKNKAPDFFKLKFLKKIKNRYWKRLVLFAASYGIMVIGSLLLVWAFYALHTINFPPEKQIELINVSLPDQRIQPVQTILVALSETKFFQPLAQYLLGVAMVFGRVAGGNTTFFLGQVDNQSFKLYFPVSYLLKTPLSFLILLGTVLVISFRKLLKIKVVKYWSRFKKLLSQHPAKVVFLLFVIYYSGISIAGNLNLGIRHLFPVLPLIFILTANVWFGFYEKIKARNLQNLAAILLAVLVFWFGWSSLASFPNYVSYHNELIGGGKNAYRYFTDSNVDWGQDLKRFVSWLKKHPEIKQIKLDYFGGGEPRYYLCKRKYDENGNLIKSSAGYDCSNSVYQEWHSNYGPTKGWIAVSVTFLQNAKFYAERFGEPDYDWLRWREPYAKIGNSIFVYWVR